MKTILSINIFLCFILFSCYSSNKTTVQGDVVQKDSVEIEHSKKEISDSLTETFYPVYVENTIMIFDSVGVGKNCYLIDLIGQSVVRTETSNHKIFSTEIFEKKITTTNVSSSTKFQLAYIGDTAKIEWIKKKAIEDVDLKKSIMNTINLSEYDNLFENYGGPVSAYSEKIQENPIVEAINYGSETLYLVTYKLKSYPDYIVNGPSFLISHSGKEVHPLSGPCSDAEVSVFILNEKLYIHTGSNCCDCGIVVEQLYEYFDSKIKQIIEDGSWST